MMQYCIDNKKTHAAAGMLTCQTFFAENEILQYDDINREFGQNILLDCLNVFTSIDYEIMREVASSKCFTLTGSLKAKIVEDLKDEENEKKDEVLYGYMYGDDGQRPRDQFFDFVPQIVKFKTLSATFSFKKEDALKFAQLRNFIIQQRQESA